MQKKGYFKYFFTFLFSSLFCFCLFAQKTPPSIERRGIVLYPGDITSVGADIWVELLSQNNINLLGIHADTRFETLPQLKSFLGSIEGQTLLKKCRAKGIDVEFELHVLQDILPRSLFREHPEYFRMDEKGKRQIEYNMCFSSEGAYSEIEKNLIEVCKWLSPTTNRYFLWTDDVDNAFCKCEKCRNYSESELTLIYENRLLNILRKFNPNATIAHLAYLPATLKAPQKIKPLDGVFLEYAPIGRNYTEPLSEKHLKNLKDNLAVFPAETAHILEYWLDVSMFSRWEKEKLVRLPWNKDYLIRDINAYKGLGVKSITSFGAWINQDYLNQYGLKHIKQVLHDYGQILTNPLNQ